MWVAVASWKVINKWNTCSDIGVAVTSWEAINAMHALTLATLIIKFVERDARSAVASSGSGSNVRGSRHVECGQCVRSSTCIDIAYGNIKFVDRVAVACWKVINQSNTCINIGDTNYQIR